MRYPKAFLLTLLLVLAARPCAASRFGFQAYTEIEGLPSSIALGAAQGSDGLMWFATRAGLVTYDGFRWSAEGVDDGLPDLHWVYPQVDDVGRLWVVSVRDPIHVAYREDGRWNLLPAIRLPSNTWPAHNFAVGRDADGRMMAAVSSHAGYTALWRDDRWTVVAETQVLGPVSALIVHDGLLYLSARKGLYTYDPASGRLERHRPDGMPPGKVLTVCRSWSDDALWVVGESWIGRLDRGVFTLTADRLHIPLPPHDVACFAIADRHEGVFVGNASRALHFDVQSGVIAPLPRSSGLAGEGLTGGAHDREGTLWFTGLRGVSHLVTRRFLHFDSSDGLMDDETSAILLRRDGSVVLGHENGLTFLEDEPRQVALSDRGVDIARIMDLHEDENGTIWMAVDRHGLARLAPDGRQTWFRAEQGLDSQVYAVHRDRQGTLWAGALAGLYRLEDGTFVKHPLRPLDRGRHSPFVRRIVEDEDGTLFVVTGSAGVYALQDSVMTCWRWQGDLARGLYNAGFYTALRGPGGSLWVGTSRGLYVAEGDRLAPSTAPGPVIENPIYAMAKDDQDRYWFGTDAGVCRWDGRLEWFTPREGLLGSEVNRDALKIDAQGRVWVGTERGVSVYSDRLDLPPLAEPLLEFTGFESSSRTWPATGRIELGSRDNGLTALFRVVSYSNRPGLGVQARVEGLDRDWQQPLAPDVRRLRLTSLPPGDYRLRLRLVTGNGPTGPEIISPTIAVARPLTARWWFIALLLAGAAAVVRTLTLLHANRRHADNLRSEVAARTAELRASEEQQRDETRRFAATLHGLSEGVLTLDRGGRITLANAAAGEILGRGAGELAGLFAEEIVPGYAELLAGVQDTFEMKAPDGTTLWLEMSSSPVTSRDGRLLGSVLVLRDVTARRRREDELARSQKLESLGLLAGGLAHDFNNLLTIILGNVEMAAETATASAAGQPHLQRAGQAAQRARALTDQLLTFARGGAPQRQSLDLAALVDDVALLALSGARHTCTMALDADLWRVDADPGQMSQVVGNILINARQAMPDGGAVVVTGRNVPADASPLDGRESVLLEIRDDGPGIPRNLLGRIFDPYFTTKDEGSGLGLAIAYSIIKRHDGLLQVESQPGRGATFRIHLPRGGLAAADVETANATRSEAATLAGRRVLVMDDEADVRSLLSHMLQRMGASVELTADGEQAVAAYARARDEERPFDVVLCDLTIAGGQGGCETVRRLQQLDPAARAVAMSGYSHDAALADHASHGFAAALQKPFTNDHLRSTLAALFAGPADPA